MGTLRYGQNCQDSPMCDQMRFTHENASELPLSVKGSKSNPLL